MKTNQVKNWWMNAGRIIAVWVLAMGMYGCPMSEDEKTPSGKIDHPIVGVWSLEYLPSSFAMTLYSTSTNGLYEITEMISRESSIGGAVFLSVYREDGTAYEMFLTADTYGWMTFNYSVKGDVISSTKNVGTYNNKKLPSTNYENKSFADEKTFFKIRTNEYGEEQFVTKPAFREDTEEYKWTMDEWIEKGNPSWYTRIKVK